MIASIDQLRDWLLSIASLLDANQELNPEHYRSVIANHTLMLHLIDWMNDIDEASLDARQSYYSACIFALDLSVAQLQSAIESHHKIAKKGLQDMMRRLASVIASKQHSLGFWLPVLNSFYDVHVELSPELQSAYLDLANDDHDVPVENDIDLAQLESIRELIEELSDLSVFDITEHFFAQSYAMPPDFFIDLVADLYSIDKGLDIALLTLLHPNPTVREAVIATHEHILPTILLTPIGLSRLQAIQQWYPPEYHAQFNRWIKDQRKKGVVFARPNITSRIIRLKASEIDGSTAQALFIHLQKKREHRLCGLLLKESVGIKDAWSTPALSRADVDHHYAHAFSGDILLRDVDLSYLTQMINHFLAITLANGIMPDLHLLEIQEELGLNFKPIPLDCPTLIDELSVQIHPFTTETMNASLKRSKSWPQKKRFTESWFIETESVDKLVNRCCHFVEGVKVCRIEEAIPLVLMQEMEQNRDHWLQYFLWMTLWLKSRARSNEKSWQDSFFVAYAIHTGNPLDAIPIMLEIARLSVLNSIETMQEHRTHLHREL